MPLGVDMAHIIACGVDVGGAHIAKLLITMFIMSEW